MAKQHAPRFIIEAKFEGPGNYHWYRSGNRGLTQAFFNKEEAKEAIKPENGLVSGGIKYRVRSK